MPNNPTLFARLYGLARQARRAGSVGRVLAIAALTVLVSTQPVGAFAQESPDTFTLPEAEPSPTPVPQGPEDERGGVPIAPRLIDPERAPPPPAEDPAPARTPASAATPAPGQVPPTATPTSASDTLTPSLLDDAPVADLPGAQSIGPVARPAGAVAGASVPPSSPAPSASASQDSLPADAAPGSPETSADFESSETQWVAVGPEETQSPSPVEETPAGAEAGSVFAQVTTPWIGALIALTLAALGGVAWLLFRAPREDTEKDGSDLATGARQEMDSAYDGGAMSSLGADESESIGRNGLQIETLKEALNADRLSPLATPPQPPAKAQRAQATPTPPNRSGEPLPLSVSLSVVSARRSLMMFTIEYRLTLANRGNRALRDLEVSGRLDCAQVESGKDVPSGHEPFLDQVERIAPHQTMVLAGTLEMPIANIALIRQKTVSMFIPLMYTTVQCAGAPATITRFVIGTPSAANQARLQPIALDTHIGGIAGLRADKIQPFPATASA